jgi:hypothetical protein
MHEYDRDLWRLAAIMHLQHLEIAADNGCTCFLGRWLTFRTSNCKTSSYFLSVRPALHLDVYSLPE